MRGVYSVFDMKAEGVVGPLFVHASDAAAIRQFSDVVLDPKTAIHQHPEDYVLVCFGELHEDAMGPRIVTERARAREVITGLQVMSVSRPNDVGARVAAEAEADKRQLSLLEKEGISNA